jgi:hypothetical protein
MHIWTVGIRCEVLEQGKPTIQEHEPLEQWNVCGQLHMAGQLAVTCAAK